MWADNETRVDLLGFDYLVESLEVVLTEPRLLPVTVGILGDWGSGKSSLLHMVADRLEGSDRYVVVPFSPWRYEAHEDVKAALMEAILNALEPRIPKTEETAEAQGLLARLRSKVRRMMAGPAAAGRVLAPAAAAAFAAHQGLPPELAGAVGEALVAGVGAATSQARAGKPEDESEGGSGAAPILASVADFRDEFAALVNSLSDVDATIVLIDDLDRCLDGTVIDVFEAIRLFLQVSSTAFVIAANREIVQAAVERRYPARIEGDPALGKDYLEKIVQVEIAVPPLAEPEAETYMNLLFAELRLDQEEMGKLRAEAARRRREDQFSVAMNYGIAKGVLGEVPDELESDFTIVNRIAPTLSRGLRGNPRQLKRFLNMLLLRLETARRRGVTLEPAVLAKLMVLEQHRSEFERLFLWQLEQDGTPEELVVAEAAAASDGEPPEGATPEAKAWMGSPAVRPWLQLEPPLASVPLGQYFFFSRDRLSPAAPGTRLSAPLQAMLGRLQAGTVAQRRTAVDEAAKLASEEYAPLYEALLDRAVRDPAGAAMDSAVELTAQVPASWSVLAATLKEVPHKDIPSKLPLKLKLVGEGQPEVDALFDEWETSSVGALTKAVGEARKGG